MGKAIQNKVVLEAQCSDCPDHVKEEVRQLWIDHDLGNDWYYFDWDDKWSSDDYPVISEYLKANGIESCLIHWWW